MMFALYLVLTAFSDVDANPATARPEQVEIFGDWAVGCDNGRFCRAVGLSNPEADDGLEIAIVRAAGPCTKAAVVISAISPSFPRLYVDGQLLPLSDPGEDGAVVYSGQQAQWVIALLANGRELSTSASTKAVTDTSPLVGNIQSLTGVKAALLYMDKQQARLDTPTALVRRGTKPMTETLPGRYPQIYRKSPPTGMAPVLASREEVIGVYENFGCEGTGELPLSGQKTFRLDKSFSLLIIDRPCDNGSYNTASSVLIVDQNGAAQPARFDIGPAMASNEGENNIRMNVVWDEEQAMLSTFAIGDSFGSCGIKRQFVWDEAAQLFHLAQQEENGECMRTSTFITTWSAEINEP